MAVQLLEDWLLKEQEKIITTYRELNQAPLKEPGLIFIGDSIVEYFPIHELLQSPKHMVNRGVRGYKTDLLREHLDAHVFGTAVDQIFLLIGTNDIGKEIPQKETTPFYPRSPYGVAKQYGFWITKNYRESYGMFAVNGILFNHESERRGETFVTRKITLAAARIAQGFQDKLYLGNLDARRDWGYAKDYVECMWLILQHDVPEDFVIATGEMHTVREFATLAFKEAGIDLCWEGEGVNEKGVDVKTGKALVEVDSKYFRPCEVEQLLGDPTKAKTLLGWNPTKTGFSELVKIMVMHDMQFVKKLYIRAQLDD